MNSNMIDNVVQILRKHTEKRFNGETSPLLNEFVYLDKDNFNAIDIEITPVTIINHIKVIDKVIHDKSNSRLSEKIIPLIDREVTRWNISNKYLFNNYNLERSLPNEIVDQIDFVSTDPRIIYCHDMNIIFRYEPNPDNLNEKQKQINDIFDETFIEELKRTDEYTKDMKLTKNNLKILIEYLINYSLFKFLETDTFDTIFKNRFNTQNYCLIFIQTRANNFIGRTTINKITPSNIHDNFAKDQNNMIIPKVKKIEYFKEKYYNKKFFKEFMNGDANID